ncbi:hypothetical protein HDV06_005076 [Boothiomyces sp. JEL0866]|nr:hypothetical protein HDV06_005076 [Boothiomyces sp. JEL0866]
MADQKEMLWVEKYRPKSLGEVVSQEASVQALQSSIESKNLPHLLFYGPAGTGKTSTIIALAKEIYKSNYKSRVLEMNASDERGINVVRTKIKDFAKLAVSNDGNSPPYKLIILDEADSLTADAQAALRRTMETYSKVTRYPSFDLDSVLYVTIFKPLPRNQMIARLDHISEMESLYCTRETLEALVDVSEGDLRQAITMLQTAKQLFKSNRVTQDDIYELTGMIPNSVLNPLVTKWQEGNFDEISEALKAILQEGYSGLQIISQLHKEITEGIMFSKVEKQKLAVALGKVERKIVDGADEHLQLLSLKLSVAPCFEQGFSEDEGEIVCYRRNYFAVNISVGLIATNLNESSSKYYTIQYNIKEEISKFMVEIEAKAGKQPIYIAFFNSARQRLPERPKLTVVDIEFPTPGEPVVHMFERMQFQSSTPAGSKGSKKYVEFFVKLYAQLENGHRVLIATSTSQPFIIRGMSPKYYKEEKLRKHLEIADLKAKRNSKDTFVNPKDVYVNSSRDTCAPCPQYDIPESCDLIRLPPKDLCFNSPTTVTPKLLQPTLFKPYQKYLHHSTINFDYGTYLPPNTFQPLFAYEQPSLPKFDEGIELNNEPSYSSLQNNDFLEYIDDFEYRH